MATNFPSSLDNLSNPSPGDALTSPSHAGQHADANDAIEALQAKVGIDSSAVTSSHDYKITDITSRLNTVENSYVSDTIIDAKGDLLVGSGADTVTKLTIGSDGYVLTADSTQTDGVAWKDPTELPVVVITTSSTSKTLALSDANALLCMTGANTTVTVPPNSSVAFPVGTQVTIQQAGAGLLQIVAGSGVSIEVTPGLKLRTQYSVATLIKRATDLWVCFGDLVA